MTQGNGPGIQFNGPDTNVRFSTVEENLRRERPNPLAVDIPIVDPRAGVQIQDVVESRLRPSANPLAPQIPSPPPRRDRGIDFGEIDEREAEAGARSAQEEAEQLELEARHGQGETTATQFARGALSALLAPGALLGMAAETAGAAVDAVGRSLLPEGYKDKFTHGKILEDFGRSLGRSSTGRSALEASSGLAAVFSGETAEDAASIADQARIIVDEQERAWPLLSTASQVGGGLAFGLATGGLAQGGAAGTKALMALGAYEGAAAGAQAAYDEGAPITEVWTSALMGGTLGAGGAGVLSVGGKLAGKAYGGAKETLQKVFTGPDSFVGSVAEGRVAKAIGVRGKHWKQMGDDEVRQVARDVAGHHLDDGTPVIPENVLEAARMDASDLAGRLTQAREEVGAKLGAVRERASAFIDQQAPHLRPSPSTLAQRIETEVVAPLSESISPASDTFARQAQKVADKLRGLGDDISLEQLAQKRIELDPDIKFNAAAPDTMKRVRGIIEDDIAARVDMVAETLGEASYGGLKRQYRSLRQASDIAAESLGEQGHRFFSLTDNTWALGALVADMASGGAFSAAKAAAVGFGHKFAREHGSTILTALAKRFIRTPAHVDVAVVGGREAQEAMTELVRARKFITETADRAGPNANVRAVAENTAQEVVATELAKRAGNFDPATWATTPRALTPLARVVYRTPILDAVSNDLAATVQRTEALRPSLDFDIDAGKLSKLAKGADGTQAIATLQTQVRDIADNYTALGRSIDAAMGQPAADQAQAAALLPRLRMSLDVLNSADTPAAMFEGHQLARDLMKSGATTDAQSLMLALGDDGFGEAGRVYRQLTAATTPTDMLKELSDPAKLRDALKTLELRGQLSQPIADEHRAILGAHEARQKLTGEALPEGVRDEMRAIEQLWSRGEETVTLDGTRLGRVVDAFDAQVEQRVSSRVPRGAPEHQVGDTIKRALAKLEPTLRPTLPRLSGRVRQASKIAPITAAARTISYEQKLDQLSQAVVQPNVETQEAALSQAPPEMRATLVMAQRNKLETLMRDLPKPRSDIHGTAWDSLSSEEIRKGHAMIDATMEPMSIFEDFASGDLDPDKVAYAWKQYPGLQKMAQMGVLDMLQSQMSPDELSALPDPVLTQLDYMLGFNGALQGTVEFSFSQRMTAAYDQMQQGQQTPSPPNKGLSLPTAAPSLTERLGGAG